MQNLCLPEDELALGERVRSVDVVTVIQIEALFGAEPVPQATQLDGEGPFVAYERVRRFVAGRLGPKLEVLRVQTSHLQVLERQPDASPRSLLGAHAESFHLEQRNKSVGKCG